MIFNFNKIPQSVEEMYLTDEEKKERRLEREYGINNISDRKNLQHRLEKIVSDGIQYSAYKDNPDAEKRFEEIKTVIPQFEEFKEVYLQLRVAGIEDELYKGIDYKTVSYAELLERAKAIIKEHAELKQQSEIPQEIETFKKTTPTKESKEVAKEEKAKIRPMEESRRDEAGDEVKNTEQQMQIANPNTTDLWVNRFSSWYSAIDRVSQKAKAKFVKMKSDIIKAISKKIKERKYKQEINKNQDQK